MDRDLTLDEMMQRDAAIIKSFRKSTTSTKVEPEWTLLAEFGLYFGWQAVLDVRENRISFAEMHELIKAARVIKIVERYNFTVDVASASNPGEKGKTLEKHLNELKGNL